MVQFIYTGNGYRRLDHVAKVTTTRDGKHVLRDAGGDLIDDNAIEFMEKIVSLVPVQGDWECLFRMPETDGGGSYSTDPVIAWALTVGGVVVPVTPTCPAGVDTNYALRKAGDLAIYDPSTKYPDLDSWIEATVP